MEKEVGLRIKRNARTALTYNGGKLSRVSQLNFKQLLPLTRGKMNIAVTTFLKCLELKYFLQGKQYCTYNESK